MDYLARYYSDTNSKFSEALKLLNTENSEDKKYEIYKKLGGNRDINSIKITTNVYTDDLGRDVYSLTVYPRLRSIYIAGSYKSIDLPIYLSKILEEKGYVITFKWWEHLNQVRQVNLNREIKKSDIFIFLPPGGRGAHIELGVADILNIPIIAWGEFDETCQFYKDLDDGLVNGTWVTTQNELLKYLEELNESR